MASSTSQLIVSLIDRVSGPAKAAGAAITNLHRRAVGAAAATQANLARSQSNMIGALGMGYALQRSLSAPVKAAADFESVLLDIAQKADLSDTAMKALGERVKALGKTINATATETAKGIDILVGMGADPGDAEKLMGPIGRAATAYKASIDDLSKAGFSSMDNLKVKAEDFGRALDIMAQSGKEGAFEIRDMAAEFPTLTAAAAGLEMKGVSAVARLTAALQIARKGAGTGAEAATNTANLMQKVISPETTKKFSKMGVDIRKELKKTQKAGGDVFEMIAEQVNKALKGDLSKLGDLFEDAQVQKFLRPLIQNLAEYKRIRDKSMGAKGVVDADFERRLKTFEARLKGFTVAISGLGIAIGDALMPGLSDIMGSLTPIIEGMTTWVKANPELVSGITKVAAALIGLRVAGIAAAFVFNFMKAGALVAAVAGLATLKGAFTAVGAALMAFSSRARLAAAAMAILRVGMLAIPGVAILTAIGAAGVWIYNNWSGVGKMFSAFFKALKEGLAGSNMEGLSGLIKSIETAWDGLTGKMDEGKLQAAGKSAGESVAGSIRAIGEAIEFSITQWQRLEDIVAKGFNLGSTFREAVKEDIAKQNPTGAATGRSRWARRGQDASTNMKDRATDEGASIVQKLDQSAKAGAAGQSTGQSFFQNLEAQLKAAAAMSAKYAAEIRNNLQFNVSPSVTPRLSPMSMPGGGQSGGGKVDRVAARHAQLSDGGNFTA